MSPMPSRSLSAMWKSSVTFAASSASCVTMLRKTLLGLRSSWSYVASTDSKQAGEGRCARAARPHDGAVTEKAGWPGERLRNASSLIAAREGCKGAPELASRYGASDSLTPSARSSMSSIASLWPSPLVAVRRLGEAQEVKRYDGGGSTCIGQLGPRRRACWSSRASRSSIVHLGSRCVGEEVTVAEAAEHLLFGDLS